jgi:tRNA dimethylallyltransferase
VRAEAGGLDAPALHARLAAIDPEDAQSIRPSDRARIVRAMEVFAATGQSLAAWQQASVEPPLVAPASAVRIVLAPDRGELHRRISERAEHMVIKGLAEVEALQRLGLAPDLPAMKAIGVPELIAHLKGDTSLDEAIAAIKTETRRYAKRQMTWFRGQMGDWPTISDPATLDLDGARA